MWHRFMARLSYVSISTLQGTTRYRTCIAPDFLKTYKLGLIHWDNLCLAHALVYWQPSSLSFLSIFPRINKCCFPSSSRHWIFSAVVEIDTLSNFGEQHITPLAWALRYLSTVLVFILWLYQKPMGILSPSLLDSYKHDSAKFQTLFVKILLIKNKYAE